MKIADRLNGRVYANAMRMLIAIARSYTALFPHGRGRLWLARNLLRLCQWSRDPLLRTRDINLSGVPIKYHYSRRSTVGLWLDLFGHWELSFLRHMVASLRDCKADRPVVLDIGANYGLYAITAACHVPKCRAFAFECDPIVADILEKNIALNHDAMERNGSSVDLVRMAVSKDRGGGLLYRSDDDGDGSLLPDFGKTNRSEGIAIETVDGDWILKTLCEGRANYCKIDVQGAEQNVLMGFRNALKKGDIDEIQIEISQGNEVCVDVMEQYPYALSGSGSLERVATQGFDDFFYRACNERPH